MALLRGWILPLLVTIILVGVFIPPDQLLDPDLSGVLAGQRWAPWGQVMLYLAVTIFAAWVCAHVGAWVLRRVTAGWRWEKLTRTVAGWLAVTGLYALAAAYELPRQNILLRG